MAKDTAKAAARRSETQRGATPRADGLDELKYEQARDELVDVVRRLEEGGTSLEDSLTLWERGEALAARCQELLDGARTRLDAAMAVEDDPDELDDEDDLDDDTDDDS